ncbi:hypothetical protein [Microbulbifer sp. GL-2]|uniref:hypothetical protein n=1 Tax=Microbulbifer sp. GL-2 TaxID=2591606 RepID=UPI00117F7B92
MKAIISIEQLPQFIDNKSRIGDWEIVTVISKSQSGDLVTVVDWKSKFTLSKQIARKTENLVTQAAIVLLELYKHLALTIIADNGKEFTLHEKIRGALDS